MVATGAHKAVEHGGIVHAVQPAETLAQVLRVHAVVHADPEHAAGAAPAAGLRARLGAVVHVGGYELAEDGATEALLAIVEPQEASGRDR